MLEIDNKNLRNYLKSILPRIKEIQVADFKIYNLTKHGNSSFVFPVKLVLKSGKQEKIYLKQSRDYTKAFREIRVDPQRLFWEQKYLKFFEKILGKGFLPHVYYYDKENNVVFFSDIMREGNLLIDDLKKGVIHSELGGKFGQMFGKIHNANYNCSDSIIDTKHQEWWTQTAIKEYMLMGAKKNVGDRLINELMKESKKTTHTVIWSDPMPKNIVIDKEDIRLFDFESVISWDPAYDIGCLLAHWLLKINEKQSFSKEVADFITKFKGSYLRELTKANESEINQILNRSIKYMGAFMLHRTDGIDPYIFSGKIKESIRKVATGLLHGNKEFLFQNGINF